MARIESRGLGLQQAEILDALEAPPGLSVLTYTDDGRVLVVRGMAFSTGRVIAVLCMSVIGDQLYDIFDARPLSGVELDDWRKDLD